VIAINGDWAPADEDAPPVGLGWVFGTRTYDTQNRLVELEHPDNSTVQFQYDGCGCVGGGTTHTDERGVQNITKKDTFGRMTEAIHPNPNSIAIAHAFYRYDELDRLVQIDYGEDYYGGAQYKWQTRTFVYDGYGRLASETTPEAGTVSYTYTAADQVATVTNQRGKVVTYSYNTRKMVTAVSYNDSTPGASYQYDEYGARTQMSDGQGMTTYVYNSFRELQSETRTFAGLAGKQYTLSYTYNQAGQMTRVNYGAGTSEGTSFQSSTAWASWGGSYDVHLADVNGDGRADLVGRNSSSPYDIAVGLSNGSGFNGSTTWGSWSPSYSLDFADVNGDGKADIVGRNGQGDVQVGLSNGSGFNSSTSWATLSTNYSVNFADVNGDGNADLVGRNASSPYDVQVALSNGGGFGNATAWAYFSPSYSLDLADVNGDGKADLLGRNTSSPSDVQVGLSNGGGFATSTAWAYLGANYSLDFGDANGDGKADLVGRNSSSPYDVQVGLSNGGGFATATAWGNWNGSYSFNLADTNGDGKADLVGRHSSALDVQVGLVSATETATYSKNVNYAYNQNGGLSGVGTNLIGSDANTTTNVWNTIQYRGFGKVKSMVYGNGRKLAQTYSDQRQWLLNQTVTRTDGSDPIVNRTYTNYDDGKVAGVTDAVDSAYTTSYGYDDYDRLNTVSVASGYTRNYSYDYWGNMTGVTGSGGYSATMSYALNAAGAPTTNRIQSVTSGGSTVSLGYDAAGNMTAEGAVSYSYDAANRLKEVGSVGSNVYGYDGDGRRVRKVESGGGAVYYVWSSVRGDVAMEINSQGNVHRAYVYAWKKLAGVLSYDGQFYWVHRDRLGSGRKMTDASGAVRYRAEFDPFGQALLEWSNPSGVTNLNSHKFTGYERDEATGLDYAQARMYHSARGRFIQPDPKGFGAADPSRPQTLNRYSYVHNDPVNFTDPTGLQEGEDGDPEDPPPPMDPEEYWARINASLLPSVGQGAGPRDNQRVAKALRDLPQGCLDFFGGAIDAWVNRLYTGDLKDLKVMSYDSSEPVRNDPQRRKINQFWIQSGVANIAIAVNINGNRQTSRTIILGRGYFEPLKDPVLMGNLYTPYYAGKYVINKVDYGVYYFQSHVLAHEFLHIAYNMSDDGLVAELANNGVGGKKANIDLRDGASWGLQKWIAGGCQVQTPKKEADE